jgi:hypothetical protein
MISYLLFFKLKPLYYDSKHEVYDPGSCERIGDAKEDEDEDEDNKDEVDDRYHLSLFRR